MAADVFTPVETTGKGVRNAVFFSVVHGITMPRCADPCGFAAFADSAAVWSFGDTRVQFHQHLTNARWVAFPLQGVLKPKAVKAANGFSTRTSSEEERLSYSETGQNETRYRRLERVAGQIVMRGQKRHIKGFIL